MMTKPELPKIPTPFSTVGYLTYKRTYARHLEGHEGATEEFEDTALRVINACDTQLHCKFTRDEEYRLAGHLLGLRGSVAGRFMWQLGTQTVERFGLASLQNCAFTVVDEPIRPFCWAMDMLALGAGVGFNIQRVHVEKIPKVRTWFEAPKRVDDGGADFIIPDSREGWVKFLGKTLKAAFLSDHPDKGTFTFSTQAVRGKGTPIKGFGGTASGPEDLCVGITKISKLLLKRRGRKIRPIDALDIMNIIAEIIVAGNVRRCLSSDTKVHTKGGLVEIEAVSVGDEVLTTDGYFPITAKFDQGVQETYYINTQDGRIECTPEHRLAVMTGVDSYDWKRVKEIVPGEKLASTRVAIEGSVTSLPPAEGIELPTLDTEVAWLLGILHGDGYVGIGANSTGASVEISFADDSMEELNRAAKALARFGVEAKSSEEGTRKYKRLRAYGQALPLYFYENFKQPNKPLKIPDCISKSTLNIRIAYLAGLFDSDGSKNNMPVRLVTTKYESFAYDVQALMYSCGLETRIAHYGKCWDVLIINDYVKEAFEGIACKTMRTGNRDQYTHNYDLKWMKAYGYNMGHGGSHARISVRRFMKDTGIAPAFIPVEVVSIKPARTVKTYDIEVAGKSEFFAAGYLVHNSAQLAIGDGDDVEYLLAKRWDMGTLPTHRAMSNNSVACDDLADLHDFFWDTYEGNSEPYGLINLKLSREVGRLGDTRYTDPAVQGYNPKYIGTLLSN